VETFERNPLPDFVASNGVSQIFNPEVPLKTVSSKETDNVSGSRAILPRSLPVYLVPDVSGIGNCLDWGALLSSQAFGDPVEPDYIISNFVFFEGKELYL